MNAYRLSSSGPDSSSDSTACTLNVLQRECLLPTTQLQNDRQAPAALLRLAPHTLPDTSCITTKVPRSAQPFETDVVNAARHVGDTRFDDEVPVEVFHPCVRLDVVAVLSAAAADGDYVPAALLTSFASWPTASLPLPCHCQAAPPKDVSMQTRDPHVNAKLHHSKVSACRHITHMSLQTLPP